MLFFVLKLTFTIAIKTQREIMKNLPALENFIKAVAELKDSPALKEIPLPFFGSTTNLKSLNRTIKEYNFPNQIDFFIQECSKDDYESGDISLQFNEVSALLRGCKDFFEKIEERINALSQKERGKGTVQDFMNALSSFKKRFVDSVLDMVKEGQESFEPYFESLATKDAFDRCLDDILEDWCNSHPTKKAMRD